MAGFSSAGPTQDQRIKPDIVAPGAPILSAGSRDQPSCDPPSRDQLPGFGQTGSSEYGILSLQGTSMATPVVSGHAALVRQYFLEGWYGDGTKNSAESMDPTGTLLKSVLINGARPLLGYEVNEVDARQGFGRLSLIDSLPLSGVNDLKGAFRNKETVLQGETNTYTFSLEEQEKTCDDAELSATLVWADPPGFVGCLNCVLNDLDLFVVQTTAAGERIEHYPNGKSNKDRINNVERVRFKAADGDSFVVTVTASHLEGAEQTYAMSAVYGCLDQRTRTGNTDKSAAFSMPLSRIDVSVALPALLFVLFFV